MPGITASRSYGKASYGKASKRSKAERLFAELPQTPVRKPAVMIDNETVSNLAKEVSAIDIKYSKDEQTPPLRRSPRKSTRGGSVVLLEDPPVDEHVAASEENEHELETKLADLSVSDEKEYKNDISERVEHNADDQQKDATTTEQDIERELDLADHPTDSSLLRSLTWDDVCPSGDKIEKIAEASYAEVYRVTNERGISIIKVIRLSSPIKAQTKTQVRSGLIDEEPRSEDDVSGELQISEWLADIPGFVVYKERYTVCGKATRQLIETHQAFQRKMKRKDPGRAQFYPSPTRYLDETKFLVVELGDAGRALEDFRLETESQLWDVFFLEAIALARAEDLAMFEHRDLHEGNLCIRQTGPPRQRRSSEVGSFGFSGLDITILDYGLSRAEDLSVDDAKPVAFDLERDLSLFRSTHAPQCKVYRQMRSFLLRADRKCLAPETHDTPYAKGVDGPLSWDVFAPYSNVLWLAYLYEYLLGSFRGEKKQLARFKKETAEMWAYLDPEADDDVPCFGSAADVVCFAVEAGWIREDQLLGSGGASMMDREDSIIVTREEA